MQIELISYKQGLTNRIRLNLTTEIINNSMSDILLFSGHTIGFVNDIETLRTQITNKNVDAILELEDINSSKINNCIYHISDGELISLNTNQLFTQSAEIEGNYQLADRLLHELETKRVFKAKNRTILVLQCGEINILKNIQREENRVEFRFSDNKPLTQRFDNILKEARIILNPIHTPMGNQGKMLKRREFLSKKKRLYFSASNTNKGSCNLEAKSLQYAFFDGNPIIEISKSLTKYSISRVYEIED